MPVLPEFSLDGKVAFLAGEGDGYTPLLAEALAQAGARVFIMAPRQPVVEGGMLAVAARGGDALGIFGDPSDPVAVERAVEAFMPIWGKVDVLVNNTRVPFSKPFEEMGHGEWRAAVGKNMDAAYLLSHRMGKEFLKRGGGKIIHIVSGLAERGLWSSAAFCASQGAIVQMTRALALEWARRNIQVNALGVGWREDGGQGDKLSRYIPLKRKGTAEDIAGLVVYLASDACRFVSGSPIYVDGGLMAHP